eukprot:3919825-Amphidinium_carterae.2
MSLSVTGTDSLPIDSSCVRILLILGSSSEEDELNGIILELVTVAGGSESLTLSPNLKGSASEWDVIHYISVCHFESMAAPCHLDLQRAPHCPGTCASHKPREFPAPPAQQAILKKNASNVKATACDDKFRHHKQPEKGQ